MTYGSQISGYCVEVVESVIGFLYAVACGAKPSYLCTDDISQEFSKGLVFSPTHNRVETFDLSRFEM
jgi:hypothetical protein